MCFMLQEVDIIMCIMLREQDFFFSSLLHDFTIASHLVCEWRDMVNGHVFFFSLHGQPKECNRLDTKVARYLKMVICVF